MHLKEIKYLQKALFTLLLTISLSSFLNAQIGTYLGYATFNTPSNQAYIETYLTFSGSFYKSIRKKEGFQNSVNVQLKISKDSVIVKALKYNFISSFFADSLHAPSFIDIQRFSLANGNYKLEIEVNDNLNPKSKKQSIESYFKINYTADSVAISDIELLVSYKKTEKANIQSKSGFDLLPYSINYYPESIHEISFYLETYHTDKVLGKDKHYILTYFIETEDGRTRLSNLGSFKKMQTAEVNPFLGKLNLSNLGTGNYKLVIELRDENNGLRAKKSIFFQRLNKKLDVVALQNHSYQYELNTYFGACNNADTLKMFVECLWPIADGVDKERIINQAIKKDKDLMKNFVIDFWKRRAGDTVNPIQLWAKYYRSVQQVMALFRCGKMPGYYTDRGRAFLQYGPPDQRSQNPNEPNTFPYEIWQYYKITDAVNGDSFTNRKFVFVSKNLGDDCYQLVHSDMRGEINNPRWQFEVTRRNSNGIANPDNNIPGGTETNHFNEIYNNPR